MEEIIITSLAILMTLILVFLTYNHYLNVSYKKNIDKWTKTFEQWIPVFDFIQDKSIYLMKETYDEIIATCEKFPKYFRKYRRQFSDWKYNDYIELIKSIVASDFHDKYNKSFIDASLHDESIIKLLENIDNKTLDQKQKEVVLSDERNMLVVAGAGSGKTLTISGKVLYLTQKLNVNPKEILLITFTNKASKETKKRIKSKLGIDVEVYTFHKLGLDIITKHTGSTPSIAREDLISDIVSEYLENDIFNDINLSSILLDFFSYYFYTPIEDNDFQNLTEYYNEIKSNQLETLKGQLNALDETLNQSRSKKTTLNKERVKSYEELSIANYLYLNNVEYEYEKPYPLDVSDKEHMQYKPDFYLPEYDIYIEHYGINKENKVPWLNKKMEEEYIRGMNWKRQFHEEENNKYIESYSYYNSEGILLKKLEENLVNHDVVLSPRNKADVLRHLVENDQYFYSQFKNLINTFINQYKANGYTNFEQIKDRIVDEGHAATRAKIFLKIVQPIYDRYQAELSKSDQIDFNDMINDSTKLIKTNRVGLNYKYVIVDEYQDISNTRYGLIDAIRNQCNSKMVVVGDDWQSIYRFAGSDVNLIYDFEEMNEKTTLTKKLEKTYRNSRELIGIIGSFVMRNSSQRQKELYSDKFLHKPITLIPYENNKLEAIRQSVEALINDYANVNEILLLGRYTFDKIIQINDKKINLISYLKRRYPAIKFKFLTVHKSKGLEGEHVILLNAENSKLGFPSKINDDRLLNLVLPKKEPLKYAEERRLFYVALTRTKNTVYIVVPKKNPSIFIRELIDCGSLKDILNDESIKCPKCGGSMVYRDGSFYGCSNYPLCDHTVTAHADFTKTCPLCGDYLVKRSGPFGVFYGCNSYKYINDNMKVSCRYKRDIK